MFSKLFKCFAGSKKKHMLSLLSQNAMVTQTVGGEGSIILIHMHIFFYLNSKEQFDGPYKNMYFNCKMNNSNETLAGIRFISKLGNIKKINIRFTN
jgi:hypothetical protein